MGGKKRGKKRRRDVSRVPGSGAAQGVDSGAALSDDLIASSSRSIDLMPLLRDPTLQSHEYSDDILQQLHGFGLGLHHLGICKNAPRDPAGPVAGDVHGVEDDPPGAVGPRAEDPLGPGNVLPGAAIPVGGDVHGENKASLDAVGDGVPDGSNNLPAEALGGADARDDEQDKAPLDAVRDGDGNDNMPAEVLGTGAREDEQQSSNFMPLDLVGDRAGDNGGKAEVDDTPATKDAPEEEHQHILDSSSDSDKDVRHCSDAVASDTSLSSTTYMSGPHAQDDREEVHHGSSDEPLVGSISSDNRTVISDVMNAEYVNSFYTFGIHNGTLGCMILVLLLFNTLQLVLPLLNISTGDPVAIVSRISLLVCVQMLMLILCTWTSKSSLNSFFQISYLHLLAFVANSCVSPVTGMAIMHLSTAWAAGNFGYSLGNYCQHIGTEQAACVAVALTPTSLSNDQMRERLYVRVHCFFTSILLTLCLAARLLWVVLLPTYKDIYCIVCEISVLVFMILFLWCVLVIKISLQEAFVTAKWMMRLYCYYIASNLFSVVFALISKVLWAYFFGLQMMVMSAFMGYVLAIYVTYKELLLLHAPKNRAVLIPVSSEVSCATVGEHTQGNGGDNITATRHAPLEGNYDLGDSIAEELTDNWQSKDAMPSIPGLKGSHCPGGPDDATAMEGIRFDSPDDEVGAGVAEIVKENPAPIAEADTKTNAEITTAIPERVVAEKAKVPSKELTANCDGIAGLLGGAGL